MGAPRIGLTTYGRDDQGRFHLYADYVDGVRRAKGLPLLLPPGEERIAEWLDLCDGFVLTGGGDLDARHYGGAGHPTNYMHDAERDATELTLVRALLERRAPLLAICRGTQVLNVALGGTLIEHLPDAVGESCPHRGPKREPVAHPVVLEPDSLVARACGRPDPSPVSWHHQAVDRVGDGLQVVGRAPDGTVEALSLPGHPFLLAVQWHPELSAAREGDQQGLFDALVRAARERGRDRTDDGDQRRCG